MASWDEKEKLGLFTRYLLTGLYGAADTNLYGTNDGQVTASEMKAYLDREMTYAARRNYGREQNATVLSQENVVLASIGGSSKAPADNKLAGDDQLPFFVNRRHIVSLRERFEKEREALTGELKNQDDRILALFAAIKIKEGENTRLADKMRRLRENLSTRQDTLADVLAKLGVERDRSDSLAAALKTEKKKRQEASNGTGSRQQVELLRRQLTALRLQLASLQIALDASEKLSAKQSVRILDLGRLLNKALASKVQELARFRSEFFGRLREVLKGRKDIRVVGDRFVFQSEVLFSSGSADIGPEGRERLSDLAIALLDVGQRIPRTIDWVLQIEGHTDSAPIFNDRFRNNWDLSAARAISVVEHLISIGIPAGRLSATGFGEFQPIDQRSDQIGHRRNRRIELRLSQR
jgi:chemotaxis protein MotB